MSAFETKKFIQKFIGLESIGDDQQRRHSKFLVSLCVSVWMVLCLLSLFMSLVVNSHKGFDETSFSMCGVFGVMTLPVIYWYFLFQYGRICSFLDGMKEVVDDNSKNSSPHRMLYERTQRKAKLLLKIEMRVLQTVPIVFFLPVLYAAYRGCMGTYDLEESWIFYFSFWAPFVLNTTVRCAAIAIIFQFPIGLIAYVAYNMFLSLFIECIWYAEAFMSDIKLSFVGIDRLATNGESERSMLELCRKAVELHIKAYAILNQLNYLANPIFSIFMPLIIITISFSLITIEKYLDESSIFELQFPIFIGSLALFNLFLLFYIGQKLHSEMADSVHTIYAAEWDSYPRSVRRFVLLMIRRAQKPFHLTACWFIRMNLERYVDVLKNIYSAFMLLRSSN